MRGSAMLSASGDWVSSPVPMRSSGMRPMPSAMACARIEVVDGLAVDRDRAGERRQHAGDHVGELPLAVAGDAGDAEDLAGMHGERDVLEAAALAAGGR